MAKPAKKKELKDADATPLHWFLVELWTKQLLGDRAEVAPVNEKGNKKAPAKHTVTADAL